MRINKLTESAVGVKGKTTMDDAKKYIELSQTDEKANKMINDIKNVAKELGGYTTVIAILTALNTIK